MFLNLTDKEHQNYEFNIKKEPEEEFLCILPSFDSGNGHEGDLIQVKQEKEIKSEKISKHQCKYCQKIFGSNSTLRRHEKTHQKPRCKVCNQKVPPQSFANHMKRHQNEKSERKFECKICFLKCLTNKQLSSHVSSHLKKFQCDLCGHFSASSKQRLLKHLNLHLVQDQYRCKFCRELFDDRESFRFHSRQLHGDPKNRKGLTKADFSCRTCGKKFDDVHHRKSHEKTHGEKIQCPFCDEKFNLIHMTRHLKLHELKKLGKIFICDICGYENEDKRNFKYHLESHFNPEKLECNICWKKFSNKNHFSNQIALKNHKVMHEAPKTCPICSKSIKRQGFFNHMKLHESKKNEKKIECKVCQKKFYAKSNLVHHMKSHNKSLECDLCEYRTGLKQHMKHHMVNHMKLESLKCEKCSKTFLTANRLNLHISRIHSDGYLKPFKCEICPRRFLSRGHLNKHQSIHFHSFRCNLCPASFVLEKRLNSHKKMHATPRKSSRLTSTVK